MPSGTHSACLGPPYGVALGLASHNPEREFSGNIGYNTKEEPPNNLLEKSGCMGIMENNMETTRYLMELHVTMPAPCTQA